MKRSIVWFKTDLRLHDNETLVQAIKQSDEIIPVYCFDEAQFSITKFGFNKTGNFRAQFLLESLIDLDKNLKVIGSGLIIVNGNPAIEISKLVQQYKVQKVFAKKEMAFEELATQHKVEQELLKLNCSFETFGTSTLYDIKDLPFDVNNIPDIFTNFRKSVEKESSIKQVFEKPIRIKSPLIPPITLPTLSYFSLDKVVTNDKAAIQFKGGETEACKRLKDYFFKTKSLSHYKETRNQLIGENYSSKFSAWLALGCISARSIYANIKQYEKEIIANESTYWLVFELLWRDYFYFVMVRYGSRFFLKKGIKDAVNSFAYYDATIFEKWKNGETGNDFIDANMIELKLTGFMSNRGRQNVASYLCNDLKQDWRYGAAYFEQQLIDYDVSSNWGNWAYLAGVGNDPRGTRAFNIEKQANDYDKNKSYRNLWLN